MLLRLKLLLLSTTLKANKGREVFPCPDRTYTSSTVLTGQRENLVILPAEKKVILQDTLELMNQIYMKRAGPHIKPVNNL